MVLQFITEQVPNDLVDGLCLLVGNTMPRARTRALNAQPHERTNVRNGCANGFKHETLNLRFLSRVSMDGGIE
ncbi:MAG TPA: hypothetical protein VI136_07475 [Verrucomicrobiae bacterium]